LIDAEHRALIVQGKRILAIHWRSQLRQNVIEQFRIRDHARGRLVHAERRDQGPELADHILVFVFSDRSDVERGRALQRCCVLARYL
jgi:hypothetical protein